MIIQGVSIREMLDQSVTVLTKPSVATFEEFEKRGGQREGFVYVGVATAIAAVLGLLLGILSQGLLYGIAALFGAVLQVALGYVAFSYAIHAIGRQQGGTGTLNEVFYTTALYIAPIQMISGVITALQLGAVGGLVSLALSLYSAYLGYLAARSSMNLDQNRAIITVVVAFVALMVVSVVVGVVLGILLGILAALFGAVR